MGLFGPKLPIDSDEFEWQLATFQWLMAHFRGLDFLRETKPFLPNNEYFPVNAKTENERAKLYFDHVRRFAGMEEWPCRLEPGEADRSVHITPGVAMVHHSPPKPLGTFSVEHGGAEAEAVIRYHPALVRDPMGLVATFAHELCHYLIHDRAEPPPGGWELEEVATDLAAVFLGFGIFTANSAKSFEAFTSFNEMGWQLRRSGYLSEAAIVTGIAIRERLGGRDPLLSAGPHLKSYLRSDLKNADAWLRKHQPDLVGAVAAVDLDAYSEASDD